MSLSAINRLEVLASLRLPPACAVPDALALVEELVPGIGSLLLWASADGAVAGGYSTLIGMEEGLRYYAERLSNSEQEEQLGGSRFEDHVRGRFRAEIYSEVMQVSPEVFRQTEAYQAMMAPYGIEDVARVAVHHAGVPLGGLAVFTGAASPPLRPSHLRVLERVAELLGAMLVSAPSDPIPDTYAGEPGAAVLSSHGEIVGSTAAFRQLLAMLNQNAPGEGPTRFAVELPESVLRLAKQCTDARKRLSIDNAWGRFEIHLQPMVDSDNLAVVVHRRVPAGLRMFQQAGGHELSARQLQAACGLAEGSTFSDLATRWGITRHTVINHVHQLYAKLGVETKTELMNRYVWSGHGASQPGPARA